MKVTKEEIIINDKDFDIKKILECGQIFSFKLLNDFTYQIISMDKVAIAQFNNGIVRIISKDIDYFYNFFDLDTNYKNINDNIISLDKGFKKYIDCQLRILKQNPFQVIISFIVSANNNIKRIKKILDRISQKFGSFLKEYNCFSFPTLNQLLRASEQDFTEMGAGYRAKYLVESLKKLSAEEYLIDNLEKLDSLELRKKLLSLSGVGPKVANCILLFGFSRTDFFPVDTWIRKAYYLSNDIKKTDEQISKFYENIFKQYSGYAQQYLYNYMINK